MRHVGALSRFNKVLCELKNFHIIYNCETKERVEYNGKVFRSYGGDCIDQPGIVKEMRWINRGCLTIPQRVHCAYRCNKVSVKLSWTNYGCKWNLNEIYIWFWKMFSIIIAFPFTNVNILKCVYSASLLFILILLKQ